MISWTRLSASCLLALTGALAWAPASRALTGTLTERAPLCLAPQKDCVPLFFLNAGERIQILGSSATPGWFQVQLPDSARSGWLQAGLVSLHKPSRLGKADIRPLDGSQAFILGFSGQQLELLQTGTREQLSLAGDAPVRKQALGIPYLHGLMEGYLTPAGLSLFHLPQLEGATFVEKVERTAGGKLTYQPLLRLDKPDSPVYIGRQGESLLLQATGSGPWGKSLLVGLDSQLLPVFVVREHEEIMALLPPEIQGGIAERSTSLMALDPQGYAYVKALDKKSKHPLLLKLKPEARSPWSFAARLDWPGTLAVPANHQWPRMLLTSAGQETFLALTGLDLRQNWVYYYAATGNLLYAGNEAVRDLEVDSLGHVWALQAGQVFRWDIEFD